MLQTVIAYIQQHQLLPPQGELIVAVSGGADSLCLLHLLHSLCGSGKRYPEVSLHVAHLNHQLRGEASERDAQEVAHLAQMLHLPVVVEKADVRALARQEHRSLEEAAREARYRFLRAIAHGQPIAVAHHMDDNVETLLLHWLRGGGIAGMIGLQPCQQDIIRPLLCVTHADTVAYCQQHGLMPLEDESNSDPHFLRNRIRHELLPLLEQLNPGIRATLLRNAEVVRIDYAWIEQQVEQSWSQVVVEEARERIVLDVHGLLSLPVSLQRHMCRRVTARLAGGQSPLELRHFELIDALARRVDSGETHELHLPESLCVVRKHALLIFSVHTAPPAVATLQEVLLPVPGTVEIPGTPWRAVAEVVNEELFSEVQAALQHEEWSEVWQKLPATRSVVYVDGDEIGADLLHIRARRPGDRIQPLGMTREKRIQDLLVDKHIERAERERVPLFFAEGRCVWVGGITIDHRMRLTRRTRRIVRLELARR